VITDASDYNEGGHRWINGKYMERWHIWMATDEGGRRLKTPNMEQDGWRRQRMEKVTNKVVTDVLQEATS
jgi:hypothetical protein